MGFDKLSPNGIDFGRNGVGFDRLTPNGLVEDRTG